MENDNEVGYTPEPWVFVEQGDANQYAILTSDKKRWVIGLLLNGEMSDAQQRATLERMVDCVNACAGLTRDDLKEFNLHDIGARKAAVLEKCSDLKKAIDKLPESIMQRIRNLPPPEGFTDEQLSEYGNALAVAMGMKRDTEYADRWQTQWGTKTGKGLFLTLQRFMAEPDTITSSR